MNTKTIISLLLALPALCGGFSALARDYSPAAQSERLFRYAPKPQAPTGFQAMHARSMAKVATLDPSKAFDNVDDIIWLDGPDGRTWFCVAKYDIDYVPVPGGYEGLKEPVYKAFEYSVYNADCQLVGTVKDDIRLTENEVSMRRIEVSSVLTKKFFNSDDRYEIIVTTACSTPAYTINYHSYAYSVGGATDENGNSKILSEIDGYLTISVDTATDSWSENYYLGFLTETMDLDAETYIDYLNSYYEVITFYKKAAGGDAPSVYDVMSVQVNSIPGDQEETPFIVEYKHDGKWYIAKSQYEKTYFEDPIADFLVPVPDNNLLINLYAFGSNGFEPIQETKIPVVHNSNESVATFYGIGSFRYDGDIVYGDLDPAHPDKAAFIVTRQKLAGFNDDYEYALLQYDCEGNLLRTIADGIDNYVMMSDLNGFEPQCMFIQFNSASGEYKFNVTNLYSGELVQTLSQYIDGMPVTSNVDRARVGDSYNWVFSCGESRSDIDGNTIESVLWVNTDGESVRIDEVNLGKKVAYALAYISSDALQPYLFNTDAHQEYMFLVKRYNESASTLTTEELVVVSANGSNLLTVRGDRQHGDLSNVSLLDVDSKSVLAVTYRDQSANTITQQHFALPMTRYAGGSGTVDDPYLIATAGDLMQIDGNAADHFRFIDDVDMTGFTMPKVDNFSGTIDGNGKFVKNITISHSSNYQGLLGNMLQGSKIQNLNFINATVEFHSVNAILGGLIASSTMNALIDGIHVYGLTINAPETSSPTVGGLAGKISTGTVISNCSVANADIVSPDGEAGGIVGEIFTGGSVRACSFTGSVKGNSGVGGIVGDFYASDGKVTDCHVNATLIADNCVGGIAGISNRSRITNCHVEGTIEALAPTRWYNHGPAAGGIVGELSPDTGSVEGLVATMAEGDSEDDATTIITGNFVNLTSLKGFECDGEPDWEGQFSTIHRIVGRTAANIDQTGLTKRIVEKGLANNYAISTLAAGDSDAEIAHNTTEGADVNDDDLDAEFFTSLGFKYGSDVDNPWQAQPEWHPALHHEMSALATPAEIESKVGRKFNTTTIFVTRVPLTEEDAIDGLICESDIEMVEMTGNYCFANNTLSIEFEALAEGETEITVGTCGASAKVKVNILASTGVSDIIQPSQSLTIGYDGSALTAPGCSLSVYNLSGIRVLAGSDRVDVLNLPAGIYMARAIDSEGHTATVKIVVK